MNVRRYSSHLVIACAAALLSLSQPVLLGAQIPPSPAEVAAYSGIHAAAFRGDTVEIDRLIRGGADVDERDGFGRTALMLAAFRHDVTTARALIEAGANLNLLENQSYDVITIAAVLNDLDILRLAIAAGGYPRAITSPYSGTALIAAAHLGHVEVVKTLIAAKAPLDHVNNLGWTALIEAIVLGDGGDNHQAVVQALIAGGADVNLPDSKGVTPLALARGRGYARIVEMLETAGAKP